MSRTTRIFRAPLTAALTVLTASGCSADVQPAPTVEDHNEADVQFAQEMIPHHRQAITMSEMALDHGGPEVTALAEQIQGAQQPEIDTLTSWLQSWDEEVPEPMDESEMNSMDHADMEGMMTPQDMERLGDADGAAFDTMWLEMMIEHHDGAVTMAEAQVANGASPEAIEMAEAIAESQEAEITEMEALLRGTAE